MKRETEFKDAVTPDSPIDVSETRRSLRERILNPLICSVVASLGIFGGISALFAGIICVVLHSLTPGDTALDRAATFLLIIAIPMILVGTVFLDEMKAK